MPHLGGTRFARFGFRCRRGFVGAVELGQRLLERLVAEASRT